MPDNKFIVQWGKAEVIAPTALSAEQLSVTSGADFPFDTTNPASIAFHAALLDLQRPDAPLCQTWAGTLRLPLELPTAPPYVWFKSDLLFSVDKDDGTRVLLVADLAGESWVKDFPFADPQDAPTSSQSPLIISRQFRQEFTHQARTLPVSHYTASFFLLAERRAPENKVRVAIDALYVAVNPNFEAVATRGD